MKLGLIGFGKAGGTIVDAFLRHEHDTTSDFISWTMAVNTAESDLTDLTRVPRENRVLIGYERVKGHGVGADRELSVEIAEEDLDEIQDALDTMPVHETDAFVIVAGLGGGTGSGGAPVLARHLGQVYTEPVYGLGILPAADEGRIYTSNAAGSIESFRAHADNVCLFDNDAWARGEDDYGAVNRQLVDQFGSLFGVSGAESGPKEQIDAGDLITTLHSGGFSSVGHAHEEVERSSGGLVSGIFGSNESGSDDVDTGQNKNRITRLVRKAALGKLTFPAEINRVTRVALVVAGPSEFLEATAIEQGREWLEDQTGGEVRAGSHTTGRDRVSATVLFSGFTDPQRLDDLAEAGDEADAHIDSIREEGADDLETLVEQDDELGDLFEDESNDPSRPEAGAPDADEQDAPTAPSDRSPPSTPTGRSTTSDQGERPSAGDDAPQRESRETEQEATPQHSTGDHQQSDALTNANETSGGATPDDRIPSNERDAQPKLEADTASSDGTSSLEPSEPTDAVDRGPSSVPGAPSVELSHDDITTDEEHKIGAGGNADVYEFEGPDGERLAVKQPRFGGTIRTEAMEQLLREAETWQQLDDHDHIVGVVDYGSEPLPWIAMEYMDGGHLGERVGEMSFRQALWTAIATTRAIRYAFSKNGVVHLDLKPENILFRSVEGAWDVPKVADWGLSKHLREHSQSVEGMSPQYAAPEQFAPEEFGAPDNVTDVYQLGVVFYELFTGRPPFEGGQFEVMNKIQNEEPDPPSEIADVPPEIDDIILTAMAKDKSDRYEDALLLRNALQDLFESV